MNKARLALAVALFAGGCGLPFHYGNYGGGPREPPLREVEIDSPRLSPDGTLIAFAFRYKQSPWKVAIVSSDPAQTGVTVLRLPQTDSWLQPNWAPDGKHFAVVSYCNAEQCYEGAKGYNVWLASREGDLRRMTPDAPDVRREHPVFGASPDELYWFVSDCKAYPNVRMDVSDRYLAHMVAGTETTVFPQLPVNGDFRSKHHDGDPGDLVIISAHAAGRYDGQGYYFAGEVAGGASTPARTAIDRIGRFHSGLFRYSPAGIDLVEPVEIEYVDAPPGGHGYVAMAHHFIREHTNAVADFRAMQDGRMLWSFRYHGPAFGVSVSDDLKTVVFNAERGYVDEEHIWHYLFQESVFLWREGMPEALDLSLFERIKAEMDRQNQVLNPALNSALKPPSNQLVALGFFAVDSGRPAVQD